MKNPMIVANTKGFSFIDVLLGVSVAVIALGSLTIILKDTYTGVRNARVSSEVDAMADKIHQTILRDPSCSTNFKRYSFEDSNKIGAQIIAYADNGWGLTNFGYGNYVGWDNVTLELKQTIPSGTDQIGFAELQLTFREHLIGRYKPFITAYREWYFAKKAIEDQGLVYEGPPAPTWDGYYADAMGEIAKQKTYTRSVGVLLNLDAEGKIQSCITGETTKSMEICKLASNGSKYFNIERRVCENIATPEYFDGDMYNAQCAPGWVRVGCSADNTARFPDIVFNTDVWYTLFAPILPTTFITNPDTGTNTTAETKAAPWHARNGTAPNSCACFYNDNLSDMGVDPDTNFDYGYAQWGDKFVCKALCSEI